MSFPDNIGFYDFVAADPTSVFQNHNEWRLWTSLFVHADISHLLSNMFMFMPLCYLLTAYFSFWFFPVWGLFCGGLVNIIVLRTLPAHTAIIGLSGVVYWMGAAWFTLFALIDTRKTVKLRVSLFIVLSIILFAPEVYQPGISYLSHLIGYIFGCLSALVFYILNLKKIKSAEIKIVEPIEDGPTVQPEQDIAQPQEQANSIDED